VGRVLILCFVIVILWLVILCVVASSLLICLGRCRMCGDDWDVVDYVDYCGCYC